LREDEILCELRVETAELPADGAMQVMAEEGQLLALLVGLIRARSVLEVGTFTGYSTLCLARALAPGGRIVTCDITDRWMGIAEKYWKRADVADRIDVRIGAAQRTMAELLIQEGPGSYDFVFIDADKSSYRQYYELGLSLLSEGGLIVMDSTLLSGRVVDEDATNPDTVAIREFNVALREDRRVDISLIAMADGLTLIRKRSHET
jgi:O-methyltransferase